MDIIHKKRTLASIQINDLGQVVELRKQYRGNEFDDLLLSMLTKMNLVFNSVHISCYKGNVWKYELKFGNHDYIILESENKILYNFKANYHYIDIHEKTLDLSNLDITDLSLSMFKRINIILPRKLEMLRIDKAHELPNLDKMSHLTHLSLSSIKRSKKNALYDLSTLPKLQNISLYDSELSLKLPSVVCSISLCNSFLHVVSPIEIENLISVVSIFSCNNFQYSYGYLNHCEMRSHGLIVKKVQQDEIIYNGTIYPPIGEFFKDSNSLLTICKNKRDEKRFGEFLFKNINKFSYEDFNFMYFFTNIEDSIGKEFRDNLMCKSFSSNTKLVKELEMPHE